MEQLLLLFSPYTIFDELLRKQEYLFPLLGASIPARIFERYMCGSYPQAFPLFRSRTLARFSSLAWYGEAT